MDKVSTLDGFENLKSRRCSGNTTRLVDHAIQLLFEGKIVIVRDAWEYGRHKQANEHLFERIIKRMSFEHGHVELKINRRELTLQIK